MPQKDRPRLYIALCSRDDAAFRNQVNCDSYHWAVMVGPKSASRTDPAIQYHLHHDHDHDHHRGGHRCYYEEQEMHVSESRMVLVRIALAKVQSVALVERTLRDLSVNEDDPTWNCLSWVKSAFQTLVADGRSLNGYVGEKDWPDIEKRLRGYAQQKRGQRRIQDVDGTWRILTIPTWNFWKNRETHPGSV